MLNECFVLRAFAILPYILESLYRNFKNTIDIFVKKWLYEHMNSYSYVIYGGKGYGKRSIDRRKT